MENFISAVSPSLLKYTLIGTTAFGCFDLYLTWRNHRAASRATKPAQGLEDITQEAFNECKSYKLDSLRFSLISDVVSITQNAALLLLRVSPRIYYWTANRTLPFGGGSSFFSTPAGSLQHAVLCGLVEDTLSTLLSLPLAVYSTFVVEERHGFNKMTAWTFIKDTIKSFVLRNALLSPIINAFILLVVKYFGPRFPLYFVLGALGLNIAALYIVPLYIMPLFNTYTPMDPETSLYAKIAAMCKKVDFPVKQLFVVDGSRHSGHSNAYVLGFGAMKRIVVYDTLIKDHTEEEVVAVLCHELGHWRHMHTLRLMPVGILHLALMAYGGRECIFNSQLVESFGYTESNAIIGFSVFQLLVGPLGQVINYLTVPLSRKFEFQADFHALRMGFGDELANALRRIFALNKEGIESDWLSAMLEESHPSLQQRLEALTAAKKKME